MSARNPAQLEGRKYVVRVVRTLDQQTCEDMRKAGLTVPTLDGPNEEVVEVHAPRDGLAVTRAMMVTTLRFAGHMAETYEVAPDGAERRIYTGGTA